MMTLAWEDLIARVRGLGTHLLDQVQLDTLARSRDLSDLQRRLEHYGVAIGTAEGAEALEQAIRRVAGERLAVLARWSGPRTTPLRIVFEEEDRRSLRALLRGLVSGASPQGRLAGLIPTPSLPNSALAQLSRLHRPREMAALLVAWGNPYGRTLLDQLSSPEPDLLQAELALTRHWALRVAAGAKKGDSTLRAFVVESLDLENLTTALILVGSDFEKGPESCFIPGGKLVPLPLFSAVAGAPSVRAALSLLLEGLGASPLAEVLRALPADLAELELTLLRFRIGRLHQLNRLQPLSSGPILQYALRVRYELIMIQRIVWGLSLGAPAQTLLHPVGMS